MKLHLYILREHIGPFFLGLFSLTFILIMNQIFLLIWDIVGKGVDIILTLKILYFYLPSIIAVTVPMSVMVASCITYSRLSSDMEIFAIRASGINPLKLNILPAILSIGLTFFMIWFNNHILPDANFNVKKTMLTIAMKKPAVQIKALVTISDFPGYDIKVDKVNYKKGTVYGVKLFDKINNQEIFAREGKLFPQGDKFLFVLKDGEIHEKMEEKRYRKVNFLEHKIYLPFYEKKYASNEYRGEREISAKEIKERVKKLLNEENTPYNKRKINSLMVEYHKKFSIPFACFIFVILGCPLAIRLRKGGSGTGFGLSIGFFIFYYICLVSGESLGDRGIFPPWLSMWLPNIILFIVACWQNIIAAKH